MYIRARAAAEAPGTVFWAAAAFRRGRPAEIRPGPGWPLRVVYENRGALFRLFVFHMPLRGSLWRPCGPGCKFAYETAAGPR